MNRLRIKHMTGFHYGGDVTASYNEARMLPTSADGQLVLYSNLEILPISSHHSYVDYWGSRVSSFEILTPHKELSLTATSLVEVRPRPHDAHDATWDGLAVEIEKSTENIEHTKQTRRTAPPEDVVAIAREIADAHRNPCDAALAISTAIGEAMEYMHGVTGVHSTAAEAWAVRKPTKDGHVTSLEAYDKNGEMIIQFFGKRKEGFAEREEWRTVMENLARLDITEAA